MVGGLVSSQAYPYVAKAPAWHSIIFCFRAINLNLLIVSRIPGIIIDNNHKFISGTIKLRPFQPTLSTPSASNSTMYLIEVMILLRKEMIILMGSTICVTIIIKRFNSCKYCEFKLNGA